MPACMQREDRRVEREKAKAQRERERCRMHCTLHLGAQGSPTSWCQSSGRKPSNLGSQWSLESRGVSRFPLFPTREWLPGAQAERHQLAVTLPQILQMEFLRSTAGLWGGGPRRCRIWVCKHGPVKFRVGHGPRRAP